MNIVLDSEILKTKSINLGRNMSKKKLQISNSSNLEKSVSA